MSDTVNVTLKKSTFEALEARATGFGVDPDDVINELLEQNEALRNRIGQPDRHLDSEDTYVFGNYIIHKLPKGKILVTKNGLKVSNMKKVLIEAGSAAGVPEKNLDPEFTTYEIGRRLFKYLEGSSKA